MTLFWKEARNNVVYAQATFNVLPQGYIIGSHNTVLYTLRTKAYITIEALFSPFWIRK